MKWLTSLPAKIAEAVVVTLVVGWLLAGGLLEAAVPLWALLIAAAAGALAGAAVGAARTARRTLYPYYAEHVRECLNTLRRAVSGEIPGVTIDDFVERGILAPACKWLTRAPDDQVRMTVVSPGTAVTGEFELVWESGHSVEARAKFSLPVSGSFAGIAYAREETQWSNDVERDPRWSKHPRARPGREYGSLVSVPLRSGTAVVGVLNVVSGRRRAFTPADLNYIELLGALVSLAWSGRRAGGETHGGGD